jgi:two-component system phosphate regulon response regulator PhoB
VLVIEDDAALRVLYRTALLLEGYAVITAADGVDGLHHIQQNAPAAVVLDLGLPRLSGHDVRREIAAHADTAHIPIIVVTGESTAVDPADFSCVLRKPFDVEDLVDAVRKCLRNSQ